MTNLEERLQVTKAYLKDADNLLTQAKVDLESARFENTPPEVIEQMEEQVAEYQARFDHFLAEGKEIMRQLKEEQQ